MKTEDLKILTGENSSQTASIEKNDKTIDYETSQNLSFIDIMALHKGLSIASEFYDVNAAITISGTGICAVALGKALEDAMTKVLDSNPIDFMSSTVIVTSCVDSDIAKLLKDTNKIAAPEFTKNALDYLDKHNICYVTINTPLKDYKQFLSNDVKVTPLGTLTQTPNLSELNKDSFKVESKTKPTVEQIEDAIFAWKVAKHAQSQALVIAKNLKTCAIAQGLQSASIEYTLDYSCDLSKEAVLASDMGITIHDINVAAQGRVGTIIVPFANKDLISAADKYNMVLITTGFTNILY